MGLTLSGKDDSIAVQWIMSINQALAAVVAN
jgi:hypothetical protein